MPLLDTHTKVDSLVGKFISDIVLQVLSFVAENERDSIDSDKKKGLCQQKVEAFALAGHKTSILKNL